MAKDAGYAKSLISQLDIISTDATLLIKTMSLNLQNKNNINRPLSEIAVSYIINLDKSKERYNYIQKNVIPLGLKVERISAVAGDTLSEAELNTKADLKTFEQLLGHLPNLGTIGCSLSHIKTWKTFLASNFEYAIIFEDDVSFDYTKLLSTIEELIPNNSLWDIVSFDLLHHGTPLTIKKLSNNQRLVFYLTEVTKSGTYIINRKAAAKLLEKALPIKMPIDYYLTSAWEFGLKFSGIEPRLVNQTFGNSDILCTKQLKNKNKTLSFKIRRNAYKLRSYTIRFLYNFKIYICTKIRNK